MSTVTPEEHAATDAHGHDGHEHPSYVAHHFDTSQQQFDAGKLGIWLFLAQEVLFFSGLFVFYVYIKALKPGAFEYAHSFLEVKYGLINTIVLITSSLTMAWGVRCAQLNQKNGLKLCLALTLMGAFGFLGVKYIEYTNKFSHGLYWGSAYTHHLGGAHGDPVLGAHEEPTLAEPAGEEAHGTSDEDAGESATAETTDNADAPLAGEAVAAADEAADETHAVAETGHGEAAHVDDAGHAAATHGAEHDAHSGPFKPPIKDPEYAAYLDELAVKYDNPRDAGLYFSVYYCMTGLHAIHVVAGIVVIVWIFLRALREDFHSDYFGPVDYVGLYWHLVDLVWIFLFPMLYLVR